METNSFWVEIKLVVMNNLFFSEIGLSNNQILKSDGKSTFFVQHCFRVLAIVKNKFKRRPVTEQNFVGISE